jgi:hypothetical protein
LGRPHVFHYFFAQSIGIAFTGLGEGDDLVGDGLPNVIGAVPDPHRDAGHLEGDPEARLVSSSKRSPLRNVVIGMARVR